MSKKFHKNPRKISKARLEQLRKSLIKLGDLSGIVHDLSSDEIISGNQRDTIIELDKCEIELVKQFDEPDEQGTVAIGFVVWQGKRYSYRQVRWSSEWCDEANILANLAGGDWDFETFANSWDAGKLIEWGMDDALLKDWNKGIAGLGEMIRSNEETPDFQPVGIEEQGRLDQKKPVTCPECGHEFVPK